MLVIFFFFKQKTAYEMRISDWSSDVCSSDLPQDLDRGQQRRERNHALFRIAGKEAGAHYGRAGALRESGDSGRVDSRAQQREVGLREGNDVGGQRHLPEAGRHRHAGTAIDHMMAGQDAAVLRSEEHTSELQSLMRISYAVFC